MEPKGLERLAKSFRALKLYALFTKAVDSMVLVFAALAAMVYYKVDEAVFLELLVGLSLIPLVLGGFFIRYITQPLVYVQKSCSRLLKVTISIGWRQTGR